MRRGRLGFGFTLVELLVVIGIIALLISILLPSLNAARQAARTVASLSNLRQLGIGLQFYVNDFKGFYPGGHYPQAPDPTIDRVRWADAIWPYMKTPEVYLSPSLSPNERDIFTTTFNFDKYLPDGSLRPTAERKKFGGYGYNYQYLGNARHNTAWAAPHNVAHHARTSQIKSTSRTIALADTTGTKATANDQAETGYETLPWTNNGMYVIDPPVGSIKLGSQGSRRTSAVAQSNFGYMGGDSGILKGEGGATTSTPGNRACRSTPAERNRGKVAVVFCDGHATTMTLKEVDDSDGDGQVDNGLWNGRGDSTVR